MRTFSWKNTNTIICVLNGTNDFIYIDGVLENSYGDYAVITGDSVTLKVFFKPTDGNYENYTGNDKNLPLSVTVYGAFLAGDSNAMKWTTVNFTNGQASVVFPSDD